MTEGEHQLVDLVAELTYALDVVIRNHNMAPQYRPLVSQTKEFLLKHRPDLSARIYD